MSFPTTIAFRLLRTSLLWAAMVAVLCLWVERVDASCGDYLEHHPTGNADSTLAQDQLPADPFSPSCRGGQCKRLPPASPADPSGPRLSLRQSLGICDAASPTLELNHSRWIVVECDCLQVMAREVLLRPPIV